jgi:hypothetical protein
MPQDKYNILSLAQKIEDFSHEEMKSMGVKRDFREDTHIESSPKGYKVIIPLLKYTKWNAQKGLTGYETIKFMSHYTKNEKKALAYSPKQNVKGKYENYALRAIRKGVMAWALDNEIKIRYIVK